MKKEVRRGRKFVEYHDPETQDEFTFTQEISGADVSYQDEAGNWLAAADSAHSDGGFKEVDATNMPGVYRLDLPDAVCATGVPSVVVMLKGAANMSPVVLEIQLTDFDLNTAAITVDGIADAVWDEAISGHTTGTTFGGKNQKVVPSETINDYKADVSALTNVTLTAAYDKAKDDVLTPLAVVDGIVDAIKVQTDKIPATPASAGEYTANIGAIKAKTDNLPLSPASSGEYTSALTAIQNDLDNPNQYKADVSNLALQATSLAIKGQTDKIPASPAEAGEYTAAIAAIQADLDNPDQYKANVSGLATTAHVQEVENKIDAIDVTTVASMGKIDNLDAKVSAIDTDSLMQYLIDGYTFEQIVEILAAVLAGKLTRSANTLTFRDLADTLDRLVVVTDNNKQRTDTTYTV